MNKDIIQYPVSVSTLQAKAMYLRNSMGKSNKEIETILNKNSNQVNQYFQKERLKGLHKQIKSVTKSIGTSKGNGIVSSTNTPDQCQQRRDQANNEYIDTVPGYRSHFPQSYQLHQHELDMYHPDKEFTYCPLCEDTQPTSVTSYTSNPFKDPTGEADKWNSCDKYIWLTTFFSSLSHLTRLWYLGWLPDSWMSVFLYYGGYVPNVFQTKMHKSDQRIRLCLGGNRTGKTFGGAVELAWWLTGRHPFRSVPIPCKCWSVSLNFQFSKEVMERMVKELLEDMGCLIETKVAERRFVVDNGTSKPSEIWFASCDSGALKFQGRERDLIVFDEEPPEDVFLESRIRIGRGVRTNIMFTMTPVNGITWTYHRFYVKQEELDTLEVIEGTIYDNLDNLPYEDIVEMEKEYSDIQKEARLMGKYTMLGGVPVFDEECLDRMLRGSVSGDKGVMRDSARFSPRGYAMPEFEGVQ